MMWKWLYFRLIAFTLQRWASLSHQENIPILHFVEDDFWWFAENLFIQLALEAETTFLLGCAYVIAALF